MSHKGFVRISEVPSEGNPVRRLQQTGIPRKYIVEAPVLRADTLWLQQGDYLTVCSLVELGEDFGTLVCVLAALCMRGIRVRSLDEPWWCSADPKAVRQLVLGLASICPAGIRHETSCREVPPGVDAPDCTM